MVTESSPQTPEEGDAAALVLDRMRAIERAVHRDMYAALAAHGYPDVRIPHIAFLAHMTEEGRRLSEFAALMQVTKPAVTQLVHDLERQGLVERVPDPTDGRATLIRATAAADEGFRVAHQRLAAVERAWRARIGRDGMAALVTALVALGRWSEER